MKIAIAQLNYHVGNFELNTEKIISYVKKAKEKGADNSCPVSTGIFIRKAIEEHGKEIPYWRLIDENHPVVKKLNLDPQELKYLRNLEGID